MLVNVNPLNSLHFLTWFLTHMSRPRIWDRNFLYEHKLLWIEKIKYQYNINTIPQTFHLILAYELISHTNSQPTHKNTMDLESIGTQ